MPRKLREVIPGAYYHVLNRTNGRFQVFLTDRDYRVFCKILGLAVRRSGIHLTAFCVMPNHWHLVVRPSDSAQMSSFVGWLSNTHTRRFHSFTGTSGQGPVYQGRFRSIPLLDMEVVYRVVRYVERNPVAAGLVPQADWWRWSSASHVGRSMVPVELESFQLKSDWLVFVNEALTAKEHEKLSPLINHLE